MSKKKLDIFIFAHWKGLNEPKLIGILSAHHAKGRKAFSFEYNKDWLKTEQQRLLDPDIQFYSGPQFPYNKENFGVFLDSMPDTWGRTLMLRRMAQQFESGESKTRKLYEVDYLLGVHDKSRMGALRFKTEVNGPFLDNNNQNPTPPWSLVRDIQHAVNILEENERFDEVQKWLNVLITPGTSLGGARPKANILDENNDLWIAKFPSKNDIFDKGAWEFLAYQLARSAGVNMAPCRIEKIIGNHHTFFTKRFDREKNDRIHFASAMTMTGNNEELIKTQAASYLDIAEFISNNGVRVEENLHQLWRRIVFNIAISNTDDHLRNHGFILTENGWILSPAYDLNPSIDKNELSLNIDLDNNALDYSLAKSVGEFFRLKNEQMNDILRQVSKSVNQWNKIATSIGISKSEQELLAGAFNPPTPSHKPSSDFL